MTSRNHAAEATSAAGRLSVVARAERHPLHLVYPCDICAARAQSSCAPLDPAEQARLAAIMSRVKFEPGRSIFDEGAPAEGVYTVTAGAVKVFKLLADGRRQVTGFLFPGDFLGLTHDDRYAYGAEVMTATSLCRFPRRGLEALLAEMPALEHRLLDMASHELAAAQDQMLLLGRKSARERLASFLLMLSEGQARRGEERSPVSLPMSRADIADYLGLTSETVSRTFTQLKTQGLLQLPGEKEVSLVRPDALRSAAGA